MLLLASHSVLVVSQEEEDEKDEKEDDDEEEEEDEDSTSFGRHVRSNQLYLALVSLIWCGSWGKILIHGSNKQ